VLISDLGSGDL